jgi:hypothetical protein
MDYYVESGSDPQGPISESEIQRMLDAGSISENTLCAEAGGSEWVRVGQLFKKKKAEKTLPPIDLNPKTKSADLICTRCWTVGVGVKWNAGGVVIEFFIYLLGVIAPIVMEDSRLWSVSFIPGFFYSLARRATVRNACAFCQGDMIKLHSVRGQQMMAEFHSLHPGSKL